MVGLPANASENNRDHRRSVLYKAIAKLPREVRYRAQNSLDGFERARALLSFDREMSSFRAITAEEEGAAALFRSLQLRNYPGADRLDIRLHQHKAAAPIFLEAIKQAVFEDETITLTVVLEAEMPKLTVSFPFNQFANLADAPPDLRVEMAEPLGGVVSKPGVEPSNYFDDAVNKVSGGRKVDKFIDSAARSRNRILYASDTGLPKSVVRIEDVDYRERNAEKCIMLSIAVLQVPHVQSFAAHCLAGFLKVLNRTQSTVFT